MFDSIVAALWAAALPSSSCLDDISTGASNDIQQATDMARDMVTKYGMCEQARPDLV